MGIVNFPYADFQNLNLDYILTTVKECAKKTSELVNYFDGLDVQEEINNKIEEMAKNGELAEIISEYFSDRLTPQMFGAVEGYENDSTRAFQDCVQAAIDTGLPMYIPAGRYTVNGIIIRNATGLVVYGENNDTILRTDNAVDIITINQCDGVKISDFTLSCNNIGNGIKTVDGRANKLVIENVYAAYFADYGIGIDSPTGYVYIEKCRFANQMANSDAIRIGKEYQSDSSSVSPNYIYITNCQIEGKDATGNGHSGIGIYYAEYVDISGNDIANYTGNNDSGIKIYCAGTASYPSGGDIVVANKRCTNINIHDNVIFGCTYAINIEKGDNLSGLFEMFSIVNNTIVFANNGTGIRAYGIAASASESARAVEGLSIDGNHFVARPNVTPMYVLDFSRCENVKVFDNNYNARMRLNVGVPSKCRYTNCRYVHFGKRSNMTARVPIVSDTSDTNSITTRFNLADWEVAPENCAFNVFCYHSTLMSNIGVSRVNGADFIDITLTNSGGGIRTCYIEVSACDIG